MLRTICMKALFVFFLLIFLQTKCYCQVPNDDCATAFDYGVFPDWANPPCPNGAAPYVGANNDLTNVTPSSPFYSMTGCQGYVSATTTLADDIWYKYRGINSANKIWMFGFDTLHVNFYYGTNCNTLQPSGCFTYIPAYNDTIFNIYSNIDTINYYNYIQISSNISGKQFGYFVCLDQPSFIFSIAYGTFQINNNVIIGEFSRNIFVSVFPNPSSDQLNVKTNSKENLEIIVMDLSSRKILQKSFISSCSLNTQTLPKGIYLYEIMYGERVIKQGKVVRN